MEDRKGSLWVGYELMGVTQLQVSDDRGFRFVYPSGQDRSSGTDAEVVRAVHYGRFEGFEDCLLIADKQGEVVWMDSTWTRRRTLQLADNVYCFAQDPDGGLWMGTRGSGIWHKGSYLRHDEEDEASLSNDDVYSLLFDRKGTLWAGTLGGGLCRASDWKAGSVRFDRFFQDSYGERRVRSLAQDSNGMIWAGTSHGVLIFDPEGIGEGEGAVIRLTCAVSSSREAAGRSFPNWAAALQSRRFLLRPKVTGICSSCTSTVAKVSATTWCKALEKTVRAGCGLPPSWAFRALTPKPTGSKKASSHPPA